MILSFRSYKITIECDETTYVKAKQWDVPFDIVPDQSFVEVVSTFDKRIPVGLLIQQC